MADLQINLSFSEKTPDQCFQTAERILPESGFTIWKTRPIGWLILANQTAPGGEIQLTFSARPMVATEVSISLASEMLDESELQDLIEPFVTALTDALS